MSRAVEILTRYYLLTLPFIFLRKRQHGSIVDSTIASQLQGPRFDSGL
ncbi:hypothetical protein scyTo_0002116, partial [Scyliorhinus torazame]|nr:hypothetical protein [Scyliorhinus torazame]